MKLYCCGFCENFQDPAGDLRKKGLCEKSGQLKGPHAVPCSDFELIWRIKRRILRDLKERSTADGNR